MMMMMMMMIIIIIIIRERLAIAQGGSSSKFLPCGHKEPGSNSVRDTDHPEVFRGFRQLSPSKFRHSTLN